MMIIGAPVVELRLQRRFSLVFAILFNERWAPVLQVAMYHARDKSRILHGIYQDWDRSCCSISVNRMVGEVGLRIRQAVVGTPNLHRT
jgi:hypothetical protein